MVVSKLIKTSCSAFFTLSVFLVLTFSCIDSRKEEIKIYLDPTANIDERVEDLLERMTLREKVGQMNQYVGIEKVKEWMMDKGLDTGDNTNDFYASPNTIRDRVRSGEIGSFLFVSGPKEANELQELAEQSSLKIPLLIAIDAIHGHAMFPGGASVFPTSIGLSCAWDTTLVRQIGEQTAAEMRATGYNWTFFPNVDVLRDPRWGRCGETFGEDPFLVSSMAAAYAKGLQNNKQPVLACLKHFIAGSAPPNGLNFAPMDISDQTLNEIYLPPYKQLIKNGVRSVMAAHHPLNGIPMHSNKKLLNDLLKNELGFEGIVVSDWNDIFRLHALHKIAKDTVQAVKLAVEAGVDVHMHGPGFLEPLIGLVESDELSEDLIDKAVAKILKVKFELGLFENRYVDEKEWKTPLLSHKSKKLALKAAEKSIVLLKNENALLPLNASVKSIFITGPNANNQSILGDWSLLQNEENVITVLEGIKNASGNVEVDYYDCGEIFEIGNEQIIEAVKQSEKHDLTLVVVGGNALRVKGNTRTYGENTARSSINLAGKQLDLVKALHKAGRKVVVVFVTGRPTSEPWIAENIPAVLYAWEPGMQGGQAIANVLLGKVNPSGKLSVSFPRTAGHIPCYYNHFSSMFYREYALDETSPLYPFGYGLSYTDFSYEDLKISLKEINHDDKLKVSVKITNTGGLEGTETVQLYLNDNYASVVQPVTKLVRFLQHILAPGEVKTVEFNLSKDDLKLFHPDKGWVIEPGKFTLMVGSGSENLLKKDFVFRSEL